MTTLDIIILRGEAMYSFGRQGPLSATVFYRDVESFATSELRPERVSDQSGGRPGPVTLSS
jgi:hypothetical protein